MAARKRTESDDSLRDALYSTRDGYEDERIWHKFLWDAYTGAGGFQGRVRMPLSGYLGAGAEVYARGSLAYDTDLTEGDLDTYLDRFPRELVPEFQRRVHTGQYSNHVEVVVDLRLSFLARKPMGYEGAEHLRDWMQDVDGQGMTWEQLQTDVLRPRATVLGWAPCLFDLPETPESLREQVEAGQLSQAQAREAGIAPVAIPLFPANLLAWRLDRAGRWVWAKIRTSHVEQDDPFGDATKIDTITIWRAQMVETFEYAAADGEKPKLRSRRTMPNRFGIVPLVIWRAKPACGDRVYGQSSTWSISQVARRGFNYQSELDQHLRATTFAMLQVPVKDMKGSSPGKITVGAGNALPVPHDSTRDYKWLSPDPAVAQVYQEQIRTNMADIYRLARSEFARGVSTTSSSSSGVSRAYEFETANRAIADMAKNFAASEQTALRIISRMDGAEDEATRVRVIPASKFDVEEMLKQLEETASAIDLKLGPTAESELRKRVVRAILPNLDDEVLQQIENEIEGQAREAEQARTMGLELMAAGEGADVGAETADQEGVTGGDQGDQAEKGLLRVTP